jgi:hypothetical protein
MNYPRNDFEVHAISSRPWALRRSTSARNGQRDSSGHSVACAYLEQGQDASLAPFSLAPPLLNSTRAARFAIIRTGTARTGTLVVHRSRKDVGGGSRELACSADRNGNLWPRFGTPHQDFCTASNVHFQCPEVDDLGSTTSLHHMSAKYIYY